MIFSHCRFDDGFNDVPTESVPFGFQQLIQANQDSRLSQDSNKIASNDLIYFVYSFVDKEVIIIPVHPNDQHRHFSFQLCHDLLLSHVYIDQINEKSSVVKAFNKSTCAKLKDSFLTHIEVNPVSCTKDVRLKLETLYQEHLCQNQGVVGKNFSFSITFAPEKEDVRY